MMRPFEASGIDAWPESRRSFESSGIDAWPESRRAIVVVYCMLAMCVQVGLGQMHLVGALGSLTSKYPNVVIESSGYRRQGRRSPGSSDYGTSSLPFVDVRCRGQGR